MCKTECKPLTIILPAHPIDNIVATKFRQALLKYSTLDKVMQKRLIKVINTYKKMQLNAGRNNIKKKE